MKEYNIASARPVSRARDRSSTKSGTSPEAVTAAAAGSAKSVNSAAEPAEAESEYITARDEACGRPRFGSSR